jgi:hypothetical protein
MVELPEEMCPVPTGKLTQGKPQVKLNISRSDVDHDSTEKCIESIFDRPYRE